MAKKVKVPKFLKPPKAKKPVTPVSPEAFNRLATSVPNPVVPPEVDDHKVRDADLKRSVAQMAELAPHSDEAVAAGLPLKGYDEKLVSTIAAVPADGATGTVGWVTARKIAAAIAFIRGK